MKLNAARFAQTLKLLQKKPLTAHTLADKLGIHLLTAQGWMCELYKERLVYVCAWKKDSLGRDRTPVYSLGRAVDAPRHRTPREEVLKNYRERKRKEKRRDQAVRS